MIVDSALGNLKSRSRTRKPVTLHLRFHNPLLEFQIDLKVQSRLSNRVSELWAGRRRSLPAMREGST